MSNQAQEVPVASLTQVAVEYDRGDAGFVQDIIAPVVEVNSDIFKYTVWGREDLKNVDRTERAIGAPANEVSPLTKTYVDGLIQAKALKDFLEDEVAKSSVNPQRLRNRKVQGIVRKLKVACEANLKALLDASTNTASTTARWDTGATTSIEADIDTAKLAMINSLGLPPTHMIVSQQVANAIRRNATIRTLSLYNSNAPEQLRTGNIPDTLFGLRVIVPGAVQDTALPGAAASISQVWAGETVYFLYVDPSAGAGDTATALLRFRNAGDAQPYATMTWRDADASSKKDWFSSEIRQTEKLVTPEAVYTLTDALA